MTQKIRKINRRRSLDIDKSETAPLFPSNAPSASISPTAPMGTGTINRTLLHHQQQTHGSHGLSGMGGTGMGAGSGGTLGSHRNGNAGMKTGLASCTSSPLASSTSNPTYKNHPQSRASIASSAGHFPATATTTINNISTGGGTSYMGSSGGSRILASPSPPPRYDVVVHSTRHGLYI